MRRHWARAINNTSGEQGQAIVEFALVLPILLLLLLGLVDYSRAIHARSIITNMSREAANLIARANPNVNQANELDNFQNVMNLIAQTAQPLDMGQQGMMFMYRVELVDGTPTTTAGLGWNGVHLSPAPAQKTLPPLGGITLFAGQVVYVVEVYYQYQSVFPGTLLSPTLYAYSIF